MVRGIGLTSENVNDSFFNDVHASSARMELAIAKFERFFRSRFVVRRFWDPKGDVELRDLGSVGPTPPGVAGRSRRSAYAPYGASARQPSRTLCSLEGFVGARSAPT